MGASQSKAESDENVFYSDASRSIQFSQDVVNHLSDNRVAPAITPQRQMTLDAHIRSRIQAELGQLRQGEEDLRRAIEQALEKENLDQDRRMAGASDAPDRQTTSGDVKSSAALLGDLEEIGRKVDRFQRRRQLSAFPEVKARGEAVVACYRDNVGTTLNCRRQVCDFKASVSQVEQQYINSLQ